MRDHLVNCSKASINYIVGRRRKHKSSEVLLFSHVTRICATEEESAEIYCFGF